MPRPCDTYPLCQASSDGDEARLSKTLILNKITCNCSSISYTVLAMRHDPFDRHDSPDFDEHVPSGGVYANDLYVWHTAHELTLDFFVNDVPRHHEPDATLIVARVRLPSTAVGSMLTLISGYLERLEVEQGRLRPRPPEER